MGGRRIAVRILGLASTTRGFAFATTEGPRRLVDYGLERIPPTTRGAVKGLDNLLRRTRPLFVAFEHEATLNKRARGQRFGEAVTKACDTHGIMILRIESERTRSLSAAPNPSKWDVGDAVAKLFPEIADRLPARRKPWQSEDDRIGIFMALAAAVAAWEGFRTPRR